MPVLVIAEHDNRILNVATGCTITAAQKCGDTIDILIMGYQCDEVAKMAAQIKGVSRVLLADSVDLQNALAENAAEQILLVAQNYSHIFSPATSFGKSVMPRVAACLDVEQISEITEVIDPDTFVRPIYSGNVFATVHSEDPVKVVTVRATAFGAARPGGTANIEKLEVVGNQNKSAFISRQIDKTGRPELSSAKIIVAGGQGVASAECFPLLEKLADKLGAAVGASRAAVDAGCIQNDLQIGQTGKIVAPELYFAIGISGAVQHVAGIKDSKIIVAINQDPDAPIFRVSDYGIVGDVRELLPQLIYQIDKKI